MIDTHNNAAAFIVAAAARSGLLHDVANVLHHSSSNDSEVLECFACGVLKELTNRFKAHCRFPGDFYLNDFCIPEYPDEDLISYMHVPFGVPKIAGATNNPSK